MDYKHVLSIIDNESEQFDSVITKTEKAMLSAAVNAIKKLDVDASGNIRTTTANIKLLATIRTKLATVASNKEFMSGVKSVANAMDKLYKAQVDFYSKAFPQKTLGENAKKKHQALQQIAISNVASGLSQSALTASVVEPLNKMLLRAVTSGSKYADLIDEFHKQLESSDDSTSALAKYAKTYATTAMTQLAGENNRLFTDDLGTEWFQYVGSVIETSRQFCELLTEKEYIHKSEIKDILNGYIEIDGKVHECEMNPKTGLPKGLIEGTTEQNFQVNVGGWNCRHQLIPISELMVPEHIRAKFDKGINDNGIPNGLNAQIEQARALAKKWGLSVQLRVLDKRVKAKDIPGIQSTITTINNKSNDLQEQYNNAIKNCKEWGISTSPLDAVMRNPTSADILNAINGLNNKCAQEQKEYNAYLVEAKNAIKKAKAKSVNCSEVVDDVYTVTEDKTQWVKGKNSFLMRVSLLLRNILESKKDETNIVGKYDNDRADNEEEIEKALGILKGESMSHESANELRGNPNYSLGGGYRVNCQSCVVAYEMRRRGYNVEANTNTQKTGNIPYELSYTTEKAWIDENGNIPKKIKAGGAYIDGWKLKSKTYSVMMKEFKEATKDAGRYHIDFGWKGTRSGHIITMERFEDGKMRVYDPQTGNVISDFAAYSKRMSLRHGINVLRVDGLRGNPHYVSGATKKST